MLSKLKIFISFALALMFISTSIVKAEDKVFKYVGYTSVISDENIFDAQMFFKNRATDDSVVHYYTTVKFRKFVKFNGKIRNRFSEKKKAFSKIPEGKHLRKEVAERNERRRKQREKFFK